MAFFRQAGLRSACPASSSASKASNFAARRPGGPAVCSGRDHPAGKGRISQLPHETPPCSPVHKHEGIGSRYRTVLYCTIMARPVARIRDATRDDVPQILFFIRSLADYEKLSHEVVATEETLRETLFPSADSSVSSTSPGRPRQAFAQVILCEVQEPHQRSEDTSEDRLPPGSWEAVGFCLWFYNYSTFLAKPGIYVEDLFIVPAHRSRGLGTQMLRHVARTAQAQGCGRVEWSCLLWNEPSIGFYKTAVGATQMADWNVFRLTGAALERFAAADSSPVWAGAL